jgi:hypothetical protein
VIFDHRVQITIAHSSGRNSGGLRALSATKAVILLDWDAITRLARIRDTESTPFASARARVTVPTESRAPCGAA